MVRIIAGRWRGRLLHTFGGPEVRPTSDMVKGALFNIVRSYLIDGRVLDLFAGTGSLGLEALSRGCSSAVFVEANRKVLPVLKRNCESVACSEEYEILAGDAIGAIKQLASKVSKFNLIFMDPPYNSTLSNEAIEAVSRLDILESGGLIIVEHDKMQIQAGTFDGIYLAETRRYGNTYLSFYKRGSRLDEVGDLSGKL